MKKFTFGFVTALALGGTLNSQVLTSVQAPVYDGSWSTLHAPMGTNQTHRGVYLVKQSELTGLVLTNSVITKVGIDYLAAFGSAATGQFTLYLENTSDNTYNKGFNFPIAIAPMGLPYYTGNYNLPAATTNTGTIMSNLTSNFTYTGGGIYVAYEYSISAVANNTVQYMTNTSGLTTGGGYTYSASGPAPNTIQTHSSSAAFRPAFRFEAANSATNEIEIVRMVAPGKYSKSFTAGHVVTAEVRNNSNTTLNSIPVTLTITGANAFSNVHVIPSLAAGATTVVPFAAYQPLVNGTSTMIVTVPPDQVTSNNATGWAQEVTCGDFASIPPIPVTSYTSPAYGWNNSQGGIYSYKMSVPSTTSLSAMYFAQATGTAVNNNSMYGVLMDVNGNILATSQTVVLSTVSNITFIDLPFSPAVALTPGVDYLFGVAQPPSGSAYFPFANLAVTPTVTNFYLSPINGGSATNAHRGYMGIGSKLVFEVPDVAVVGTKSVVCKADRAPITLTVSGAETYQWLNPVNGGGATTVAVTPTIAAASASGVVTYTVRGVTCTFPTKNQTYKFNVIACTDINGYDPDAISIYPNPSVNGFVNVTGLRGSSHISVFNTLGQIVLNHDASNDNTEINISSLPPGNYIMRVTGDENVSTTIKLLKQ
jgi:hypothetical protein